MKGQEAYVYIPENLRSKIPPLYATEKEDDPIVWVKLFTPDSSWIWYLTEASLVMNDGHERPIGDVPEHIVFAGESTEVADVRCFGLVVGHVAELGYFSFAEIRKVRGGLGVPVERDLFFTPKPLSSARADQGHMP